MPSLFSVIFRLLFIMDPIGNMPICISSLAPFSAKKRRSIMIRELVIALILMLLFLFFGKLFFSMLRVESSSLQLSGGVLLLIIAIQMMSMLSAEDSDSQQAQAVDPLLFPIAVPAIAGPGILSALTVENQELGLIKLSIALLISWVIFAPILFFSVYIKSLLKVNGIVAITRIFAYLVFLIAFDMIVPAFISLFCNS